jgi:hypothetical protein
MRLLMLLTGALLLSGCAAGPISPTPTPPDLNLVTPGLAGSNAAPIYGRSAGEVSTPISVLLILSRAPRLNEPAQVTLVITSTLDAPGASAEIVLPPGAVATAGALRWTGDLRAQQAQRLEATIKFEQEGNWTLAGKALRPAGGNNVWGDMAVIYLHVTRAAGQVGFPPEPNAPHDAGQSTP